MPNSNPDKEALARMLKKILDAPESLRVNACWEVFLRETRCESIIQKMPAPARHLIRCAFYSGSYFQVLAQYASIEKALRAEDYAEVHNILLRGIRTCMREHEAYTQVMVEQFHGD